MFERKRYGFDDGVVNSDVAVLLPNTFQKYFSGQKKGPHDVRESLESSAFSLFSGNQDMLRFDIGHDHAAVAKDFFGDLRNVL